MAYYTMSLFVVLFIACFAKLGVAAPTFSELDDQHKFETLHNQRHHDLQRLSHLRDRLDRVNLRQRTDSLRIDSLENMVLQLQQLSLQQQDKQHGTLDLISDSRGSKNYRSVSSQANEETIIEVDLSSGSDVSAAALKIQDDSLPGLKDSKDPTSLPSFQVLGLDSEQSGKGDNYLTFPIEGSKNPSLPSLDDNNLSQHNDDDKDGNSHQQQLSATDISNRAKTAKWMEEEIQHLQEIVADVAKSCNVTTAVHDKQEVETRMAGLGEGVALLQGSISRVRGQSEATHALLGTLQQQDAATQQHVHNVDARVALMETEVKSLQESLNEALAALPDGALSEGTQLKVTKNGEWDTSLSVLAAGLATVKQSSLKLLDAVENIQLRQDEDKQQLLREVAKIEFNMTWAAEEQRDHLKRYHQNVNSVLRVATDVNWLSEEVETILKDTQEKAAQQTDTNYRLETITKRFYDFEKRVKSVLGLVDEPVVVDSIKKSTRNRHQNSRRRRFHKRRHDRNFSPLL